MPKKSFSQAEDNSMHPRVNLTNLSQATTFTLHLQRHVNSTKYANKKGLKIARLDLRFLRFTGARAHAYMHVGYRKLFRSVSSAVKEISGLELRTNDLVI